MARSACSLCAVLTCLGIASCSASLAAPAPEPNPHPTHPMAALLQWTEAMKQLAAPGWTKPAPVPPSDGDPIPDPVPSIPANDVLAKLLAQAQATRLLASQPILPVEALQETPRPTSAAGTTEIRTSESDYDHDGIVDATFVDKSTFDSQGRIARSSFTRFHGAQATLEDEVSTTYDLQGRVMTRTRALDIGADHTIDYLEAETWEYDDAAQWMRRRLVVSHPSAGTNRYSGTVTWTYDELRRIQAIVSDDDELGDGTIDLRSTITIREDEGRRIVETLDDTYADGVIDHRRLTTWKYDGHSNPIDLRSDDDQNADGSFEATQHETWTWDLRSRLTDQLLEFDRDADGVIEELWTNVLAYDGRGNNVHQVIEANVGLGPYSQRSIVDRAFDPQDRLLREVVQHEYNGYSSSIDAETHEYDARGNEIHLTYTHDRDSDGVVDLRAESLSDFDTRGHLLATVRTVDYDGDGKVDERTTETMQYDLQGRVVQSVFERDLDGDGVLDERTVTTMRYLPYAEGPSATEGAVEIGPALLASGPNPFQGDAGLAFRLSEVSDVRLEVFDASGRRLRELMAGITPAGEHHVSWDGRDFEGRAVPNGAYFVRLSLPRRVMTRTIVRLR